MTESEGELVSREARPDKAAGYALVAALSPTETADQREDAIASINELLSDAGIDYEVKPKDWHEKEHEEALKIEELFTLDQAEGKSILPDRIPINRKAELFGRILHYDESLSGLVHDERTIAQKGIRHYRAILRRYAYDNSAPRKLY